MLIFFLCWGFVTCVFEAKIYKASYSFDSFWIGKFLIIHYKFNRISASLASKTVKNLLALTYAHTRIFVVVKWADAFIVCTHFFDWQIVLYNVNDIDLIFEFFYGFWIYHKQNYTTALL